MKPFNLKEAKAGKPVCTRDGKPVRLICFDALNDVYPIIGLIKYNDSEDLNTFTINGCIVNNGRKNSNDLMMVTVKKEGYISLFKPRSTDTSNCIMNTTNVYSSEEECHKRFSEVEGYIKTIKVEWED